MAIQDLKSQIARLPEQPGVYLFRDAAGETLYIGKARVLRDRVRSYLAAEGASPRTDALLREAASVEVIVTDSVLEALTLENRLVKQRSPRFNVLLRDDKTYPYLQLTTTEAAPRLLVARRVERDGNVYAGPFIPAAVARRTMSLSHRLFGIRSCNEVIDGMRERPCLEYDIGRCLAPCVAAICTLEQYGKAVDQTKLLLEGRQDELIDRLRREMAEAAAEERYERAAQLRDAVRTLETVRDRMNKIETPGETSDRDAFGVKVGAAGGVVQVFQVRRGKVVDRTELVTERDADAPPPDLSEADARALLSAAVQEFYAERQPPAEIHLPLDLDPDDADALTQWLRAKGSGGRLVVPKRGDKRGLIDLVTRNAATTYQAHFGVGAVSAFEGLDTLRAVLALPTLPRRIECFDISTLHGRETVAAMVVCIDGRMRRSEYRKFRIRGLTPPPAPTPEIPAPDDFAAMEEVVLRRYQRLLALGGPFPDLILIDGGKGQLTAAYSALRNLGLERLIAIGIAKEEELIFTRDRAEGIALPRESAALHLIQRIRDEAHRFAITFHRQARRRRDLRSALDDVSGIGPRRRKQLLTTFGSVAGVRRASRAELEAVVGTKAAEAVIRYFAGSM